MAATTTDHPLTRFLGIHSDEKVMAAWTALTFLVIQTSHGLGFNAADALFFVRFGVESLPLMIVLSGPVVMVAILAHSTALGRRGANRWLWQATLIAGGWVFLKWLGVVTEFPAIYPVVWISTQAVIAVTLIVMWNTAGAACTTRQAKRLFPIFATAGVMGGIIGNALTGPLATVLGTENLLLVQGSMLVVGSALLVRTRMFFTEDTVEPSGTPRTELARTWNVIRQSRLLRLAAVVAVTLYGLFYLVYFPFSESVALSFETESEMASFLGIFSSIATAATFGVSLLVANRLFARLGLVRSLLILPVVYTAGFLLWMFEFALPSATAVRGVQWVVANAIGWTAFTALFNVVTGRRRGQVVAFMGAVPGQVGTVTAGVVLLFTSGLSNEVLFLVGVLASMLTVWVVMRVRPAYLSAVVEAVRRGVLGIFDAPEAGLLTPQDGDSRRVLTEHLDDPRPGARAIALAGLSRLSSREDASAVEPLLTDTDPLVRSAAFDSVCVIDPDRVASHAATAIADEVPEVRLQVLHYLQTHPDGEGPSIAAAVLDDSDPRVRAAAAVVVGGEPGERVLRDLLDGDVSIGIASALDEMAMPGSPLQVDPTPYLDHPASKVRAAAAATLVRTGGSMSSLRPLLDDVSPLVREAAAAGLRSTSEGRQILLDVLELGSVIASEAALIQLAPADELAERFLNWARREAERAAFLQGCADALDEGSPRVAARYLRKVLLMRSARLLRWVLLAMTSRETQSVMPVVARGVRSQDAETRAQAVEALETVGAREVLNVLLPLLEPETGQGSMGGDEALHLLAEDFDPWLAALARRSLDDVAADEPDLNVMPEYDQPATLSSMDRVLVLQRVPMFSDLDPEDLDLIARTVNEVRYGPGDRIYSQGELGEAMLVIVDGDVRVSTMQGSERRMVVGYGPGEHVGELALLGAGVRSADVDAGDQGVHGLVLQKADLLSVLEERPTVAIGMLGTLARRLVEQT